MINIGPAQRIIVVDPFLPLHDRNSGSLRLFRLLESLAADGHELTYVALEVLEDHERYAADLQRLGIEVITNTPASTQPALLQNLLRERQFDIAWLSFFSVAQQLVPLLRRFSPTTRVVIDTVDLHFVRERRQAELEISAQALGKAMERAEQTRLAEKAIYRAADDLIAITEDERDALVELVPGATVHVVPNVHPLAPTGLPFQQRQGLLFIGNFWHGPNTDAVAWLCLEILPLVRRSLPTITCTIVGQNPPSQLAHIGSGITFTGWVPDTTPFLESARLSVAPLRFGAGMKGKVGEALACGLPVVTTTIGAEGMGLRHGEQVLVSDTAETFAEQIVQAYQTPELWNRLAVNGRAHIARNYTPQAVRRCVRAVVAPTAAAPLSFFCLPDWASASSTREMLDWYITTFTGAQRASLGIGVLPDTITIDQAGTRLVEWIHALGYNPENIPDITVSPVTPQTLENLPADTIRLALPSPALP